ncbi:hypothetical protein [Qipengyuania gaetbuli]|uniref:hypothetical protein n=1 Tax=Qipengyuania gaetbuli TaxID=266952 RepID=UPI001CFE10C7|nr:hypothetical protein [Qipengyuania gaetbuli]
MFEPTIVVAAASLIGLVIVAGALLRAWHDWMEYKRRELEREDGPREDEGSAMGAARIELADLRERIKKLEAIASGVDL